MSRVLLADPDDALAISIEFLLQRAGHEVVRWNPEVDLIDTVRDEAPDLLLLAVEQGVRDGLLLCRRVCEEAFAPIVLMLSASARGNDSERAQAAGAKACLNKPFPARDLMDCVARLLRESA